MEKKQFSTYDEDLIITDKEYARRMLLKIGYFSLINGYKEAFKESVSNQFQKGTTSMWST